MRVALEGGWLQVEYVCASAVVHVLHMFAHMFARQGGLLSYRADLGEVWRGRFGTCAARWSHVVALSFARAYTHIHTGERRPGGAPRRLHSRTSGSSTALYCYQPYVTGLSGPRGESGHGAGENAYLFDLLSIHNCLFTIVIFV